MAHNYNHSMNITHLKQDIRDIKKHVSQRLKSLGVSGWGMQKSAIRHLHEMLQPGEEVGGIVYGRCDEGSVVLVATDSRVIFIDVKPMFKKVENISYNVVSGVTLEWVMFSGTLILHTRVADLKVRTMNKVAARKFMEFIEKRIIEQKHQTDAMISYQQ